MSELTLAQELIVWGAALARRSDVVVLSQAFGEPGLSRAWRQALPAAIAQLYDELNGFAISWRFVDEATPTGQLSLRRCEMPGKKLVDLSRSSAASSAREAARYGLASSDAVTDPSEPLALLVSDGPDASLYASLRHDALIIWRAQQEPERLVASAIAACLRRGMACGFAPGWLAAQDPTPITAQRLKDHSPQRAPFTLMVLEATPYDAHAQLEYLGRRLEASSVKRLLKALGQPVPDSLYEPSVRGERFAQALGALDALDHAQIELVHKALATHQRGRAALVHWLGVVEPELVFVKISVTFDKAQATLPLEAYASCTLDRALYEVSPLANIAQQAPLPFELLSSCFLPRIKRDYWSPFYRGATLVEPWRGRQLRHATFEGLMPPSLAAGLVVGQPLRSTALPSVMQSF